MKYSCENEVLKITLDGNIDSSNADEVGKELETIRNENPATSAILDFENVKYISSAGLRQILKMRKQIKDLTLVNVSSEVYEIFSMTGFTDMMKVEKAYREISVEGCEKIGEGSNGIVYRINPDTIIKVYKNPDAVEEIKNERKLAKKALILGINTAISYDIVKVGDKYGSVFEMINAKSLTKLIKADEANQDHYIKIFADLLKEVHGTLVPKGELPDAKEKALEWVDYLNGHIPEETHAKLKSLVEAVPKDDHLIHGDYHTNNVHYADGEAILIDMDTLSVGHPVFEFSSIYLAFVGYGEIDVNKVEYFLNIPYAKANYIWKKLLEYYFEGTGIDPQEVEDKAKVVGYARMLRRTIKREPENTALIDHSLKELIKYVDKADTIVF